MRRALRNWLGRLLRRWANRLHPLPKAVPVAPLEFIDTSELAAEIRRRNDCCVLFWGRDRPLEEGQGYRVDGKLMIRLSAHEVAPVLTYIAAGIDRMLTETDK